MNPIKIDLSEVTCGGEWTEPGSVLGGAVPVLLCCYTVTPAVCTRGGSRNLRYGKLCPTPPLLLRSRVPLKLARGLWGAL